MKGGKEENYLKFLVVYLMKIILFTNTSCSAPTKVAYYIDDLVVLGHYV